MYRYRSPHEAVEYARECANELDEPARVVSFVPKRVFFDDAQGVHFEVVNAYCTRFNLEEVFGTHVRVVKIVNPA